MWSQGPSVYVIKLRRSFHLMALLGFWAYVSAYIYICANIISLEKPKGNIRKYFQLSFNRFSKPRLTLKKTSQLTKLDTDSLQLQRTLKCIGVLKSKQGNSTYTMHIHADYLFTIYILKKAPVKFKISWKKSLQHKQHQYH